LGDLTAGGDVPSRIHHGSSQMDAATKELLKQLSDKWERQANFLMEPIRRESRYFYSLDEEEKKEWRSRQTESSALLGCASELRSLL
jgi:hypothetical protein